MSEPTDPPDGDTERTIYHRQVEPNEETGNQKIARLIANLENCDTTELPPLYNWIDHVVEDLFSDPPPAEAQAEIAFTYAGYRIELDQTGHVRLLPVSRE